MNGNIDALARELDGRRVDDELLRVTGVHANDDGVWVQVMLEPAGHDLVLHVHHGATAADALAALESWLAAAIEPPRVIEVVAQS